MDTIGRENCKLPGMAHKARNCIEGGINGACATTGFCVRHVETAAQAEGVSLHRPPQPVPYQTADKSHIPQPQHQTPVSMLPTDKQERKNMPVATGVLDYFSSALAEVAKVSKAGNDQHNPGQPLHWARGKSMDHSDALVRHLMERGTADTDGMLHSAKLAWRALALLQEELEAAGAPMSRASKVVA